MELKKRNLGIFLALICALFLISFVSSSISIGKPSHLIEEKYGASQNIMGWINVSISDESVNSTFKDSLSNEISILDLIKLNPGIIYSCIPLDCGSDYVASNGKTEKSLTKQEGTETYAIMFSGNIISVNSVRFNLSATNIQPSCNNQIEVDLFDDGIIDFSNTKADTTICPGYKRYGCFNTTGNFELATIETQPYCQRINLPKAPGFRIGAWVQKNTGTKEITAIIYDKNGNTNDNAYCILQNIGESGGEVYCDVNYPVQTSDDYYVCIYSSFGTGEYVTRSSTSDSCGFWNTPPANENQAYYIFAEPKKYGSFTSLDVTDLLNSGESISYLTENYIKDKYGSLNCGTDGCVVPIKFRTNMSTGYFTLGINNIKIDQDKEGAHVISDKLYDVSETAAILNSEYGKLYLDNSGLKVKNSIGEFTYTLRFEGEEIFEEELVVQNAPTIKGISPTNTAYAFPTEFLINVDYPTNISRYEWSFGDNSTAVTTTNKATHIYNNSGEYELKIVIKDKNNISSSRIFEINVTSPGSLINSTIEKMKNDVSHINNQMNSYDLFYRARLAEIIDTNNLSKRIDEIENKYNSANESDYNKIVSDLLSLNVPEALITSKATAAGYVFYPQKENINVDILKNIDAGNYVESDEAYINSIYSWDIGKITNSLIFREISLRYDGGSVPAIRVFDFTISEKTTLGYNPYFIVKDIANLNFKEDYGEKDIDGYKYIELTAGTKEIIFSTTENVSFDSVPAFIAPPLNKLSIIEPGTPTEAVSNFNWKAFGIALLALFGFGLIVYIILQVWYKKKYEGHLFKHKNDLYNIFHFIEVQRGKGIHERDIHAKLKKAGWNSEQIKYSMKKHSGKRTGMLEIPVDNVLGIFKKKE